MTSILPALCFQVLTDEEADELYEKMCDPDGRTYKGKDLPEADAAAVLGVICVGEAQTSRKDRNQV